MTVTYETPRMTKVGSLHALALTDEDGSNLDADRFQAPYGSAMCATW